MIEPETSVRFLVTVLGADAFDVAFEPEGALVPLRRGDAFTVEMRGPAGGIPEISYDPPGLTIGAWAGASTRAWNRAGEEPKL